MTNKDIAAKLGLSDATVHRYLKKYGLTKKYAAKKPELGVQLEPKAMVAKATVTYVSRPWWRRVIDWFRK